MYRSWNGNTGPFDRTRFRYFGNQFRHRKVIIIDNGDIDADLFDVALTLALDSSAGLTAEDITDIFDELASDDNRKKIKITTDAQGQNQLYVEIDYWNDATETAVLHVRVPFISSSTPTLLFFWYDHCQPNNTTYVGDIGEPAGQRVWDNGFHLVAHCSETTLTTGSVVRDSTRYQNHGTIQAGVAGSLISVTGIVGRAFQFDGLNDLVTFGTNADLHVVANVEPFSIEVWAKGDLDWAYFVSRGHATAREYALVQGLNAIVRVAAGGSGAEWVDSADTPMDDGNWHYVALRNVDETPYKVYGFLDGTPYGSRVSGNTSLPDYPCVLACRTNTLDPLTFTGFWPGLLDEIRISKVARSPAWLKASYESQRDHLVTWSDVIPPTTTLAPTTTVAPTTTGAPPTTPLL